MRLLLLTDMLRKANCIVQGLRSENLNADILDITQPRDNITQIVFQYEGFFLYFEDLLLLNSALDFLTLHRSGITTVLLGGFLHPLFFELYEQRKIAKFYVRPFPFRAIASEMRMSIFQSREKNQDNILKIRDLELDRDAHELRIGGETIYLRHKEFALLEYLMLHPGKVLSRINILENVWDRNANIVTNTVDVHINQLRKKIEIRSQGKFIKTVPCLGYMVS